jgi:hypothetical protein
MIDLNAPTGVTHQNARNPAAIDPSEEAIFVRLSIE